LERDAVLSCLRILDGSHIARHAEIRHGVELCRRLQRGSITLEPFAEGSGRSPWRSRSDSKNNNFGVARHQGEADDGFRQDTGKPFQVQGGILLKAAI
jgi:hypothetical protein